LVLRVLDLVGVYDRPADPLNKLTGKVVRLEIGGADPLSIHDGARIPLGRVSHYKYLWHEDASLLGTPRVAAVAWRQVNIG
jgi:hypothetical protein